MKGLAITNIGIEDIAASEINELIGAKTEQKNGCVVFEAKNFEDFFLLCYKSQSIRKVILLLDEFKAKKIEDIKSHVKKAVEWVDENSSFVVRCDVNGSNIDSRDLEPDVGGFILDNVKAKVNLHNPDVTFFVFINNEECYFGVDFSGIDLGKRDYRIFTGSDTLKPNVAYSLLRIAEFKKGESLLDPFCKSGTIAIEAALFSSDFPVNHFGKDKFLFLNLPKFEDYDFETFFQKEDEMIITKTNSTITAADQSINAISSSKKNAKIAGVNKLINFSRKEPEWLEVKFKEGSIDKIVTAPPPTGRSKSEKQVEKILDELFYQADFILKKKSKMVVLTKDVMLVKSAAEKHKMKFSKERKVMQGKEELSVIVFSKA